jgi:hypothetical protein
MLQTVENLAGITTIQSLLFVFDGILGVVALAFNIKGMPSGAQFREVLTEPHFHR